MKRNFKRLMKKDLVTEENEKEGGTVSITR